MTLWKGDTLEAQLPMPASLFYSDHILPARPIECPKAVGVKDSSAKNLAKWVKLAQKKGFLTAKEERKGAETMVVGINLSHPEYVCPFFLLDCGLTADIVDLRYAP
jgi:translation initiation factor 2D